MMLIRIGTLWWSVALGFAALAWLRARFPRELGDSRTFADGAAGSDLK
jgi:hypothetical protein